MRKTKIVATIGPASDKEKILKELVKAGLDVCRLNFSHGDYDWHEKTIQMIRRTEKEVGKKIGIMADVQGPRIRIANTNSVSLKAGEKVFLTDQFSTHFHKYKKELILDWKEFYHYLSGDDLVYIEDGIISLKVISKNSSGCVALVQEGGLVKPHKGVNIPAISHHMGFLTIKDLRDLEFIIKQDIDFLAVSFISSKEDLINLKVVLERLRNRHKIKAPCPWIISKIEKAQAVENLKEIIKLSDGIMVARGDLAIEDDQEEVIILQKEIIEKCRKAKKPVIVATQMLSSMEKSPRPTRAEISDVTNAVIDEADAVMLSGETASGKYPVKTVQTMVSIIEKTEDSSWNDVILRKINSKIVKLLLHIKKARHRTKGIITAKTLKEALEITFYRQEYVTVKISAKEKENRKGTLIWGCKVV